MDGSRLDSLARALASVKSRRIFTTALGAALSSPLLAVGEANAKKRKGKKRKKTCAQKCQDGCCTSKHGTCVRPGQQSGGRCGTGGETCRSTGCPECTADRPCPEGTCCSGDGTCGACLVFMTSSKHTGNVGGLTGADTICQGLAEGAGRPGTYRAWLSDDSGAPSTRFIRATVPYMRVDGVAVANSYADLTDGSPLDAAINLTETGMGGAISPNQVWTSTGDDGQQQLAPDNCNSWTNGTSAFNGDFGLKSSIAPTWTGSGTQACNLESRLYCFQQR